MNNLTRTASLFFLPIFLLLSCTGNEEPVYKIGFSQCAMDDWRIKMNEDLIRESMLYDDIAVEIRTSDRNNSKQIEDIKKFISEGKDLIIISPNEEKAIAPVVEEAFEAGIPIIIADRKVETDRYTSFIGANNYLIGNLVCEHVNQILGGKGKIVEISGSVASTPTQERSSGFIDSLSPGIDIIYTADGNWEERNAYIIMSRILRKYKDIDLVFAHNDDMAIGAYNAAKEAGMQDEILFIGVDAIMGENKGVDMVSKGILEATFIYPNGVEEIMETAMDILHGKEVPKEVTLSTAMVTKANVRLMEMQDLQEHKQHQKLKMLNERLNSFLSSYAAQRTALFTIVIALFFVLILTLCLLILLRKRKALNDKLVAQRDRMKVMAGEIEKSAQAKLVFFTNISHDIRTPLSLISGPIEKLKTQEDMVPEQRQSYLDLASRNVDILMRLVNQLLDFRAFEQGKMSFSPEKIDFLEYIIQWNESFEILLNKKAIRFRFIVKDTSPYLLSGDIDKLEKIYFNILSNAFKFTPAKGSIDVRLSKTDSGSSPSLKLTIRNSGSFIPHDELGRIFERFYQSSSTCHSSGVGIGLAMSKLYTECHNGTITAESDKESGTSFTIILPLLTEEMTESDSDENDFQEEIPGRDKSDKPVILIIDDNKDMTIYLTELLKDSYSVISTTTGIHGLNMAVKYIPDLIISDIMMPTIDGLEIVRRVKTSALSSHIPVILLTARNLEEQRVEGYESGADSYITKPFRAEVLLSRIQNLLHGRELLKKSFEEGIISSDNTTTEDEFMNSYKEYLNANISNAMLGIDEICSALGVSRTQLYRKVKSITGMSTNEYIRIFRLKKAKEILKKGNISISQVGYEVGFNSPSYFIKCFREQFGKTPSEYIATRKQKE